MILKINSTRGHTGSLLVTYYTGYPCYTVVGTRPVLLNNAPSSITDKFLTHSIQGFSNYVKNHFVNKYQQHCTIPNCYICQL